MLDSIEPSRAAKCGAWFDGSDAIAIESGNVALTVAQRPYGSPGLLPEPLPL
jgi:hypothetical protein